jgi:predicted ATP pyrophosphatase (TIGR00289 family)
MRVAALVSGGKDSILALYRAQKMGHTVDVLATMISDRDDSYMFHFPNIHLIDHISCALEIPLVKAQTSGIKEKELEDLKELISSLDVDGVVSGAIQSSYQKKRIGKICDELGLESVTPLWNDNPLRIMNELIELKFKVIIVGIYTYGLNSSWLGKEINIETMHKLRELNKKYHISLVGEGGEYESLVLNGPIFKKRLEIIKAIANYENYRGVFFIKEARLVEKN